MKRSIFIILLAFTLIPLTLFAGCKKAEQELTVEEYLDYVYGDLWVYDDGKYYKTVTPRNNESEDSPIRDFRDFYISSNVWELEFYTGNDRVISTSSDKYAPGDTLSISISNNSNESLEVDFCYIEVLLDGAWYRVSDEIVSRGAEVSISADHPCSIEVTPEGLRYALLGPVGTKEAKDTGTFEPLVYTPGSYRILAKLGTQLIAKEFTIK